MQEQQNTTNNSPLSYRQSYSREYNQGPNEKSDSFIESVLTAGSVAWQFGFLAIAGLVIGGGMLAGMVFGDPIPEDPIIT